MEHASRYLAPAHAEMHVMANSFHSGFCQGWRCASALQAAAALLAARLDDVAGRGPVAGLGATAQQGLRAADGAEHALVVVPHAADLEGGAVQRHRLRAASGQQVFVLHVLSSRRCSGLLSAPPSR
ncbi:hypothetical protein G6F22_020880 [Rhizopus arrhizus]|nr:hypothetical protein G6F22_020880 [Rhizopus arrhizus]